MSRDGFGLASPRSAACRAGVHPPRFWPLRPTAAAHLNIHPAPPPIPVLARFIVADRKPTPNAVGFRAAQNL